jgi:hypothetical protein
VDIIKSAQDWVPWVTGLQTLPKLIISIVIGGAAAFLLVLIWMPPPGVAVKTLLTDCYQRALLTRMHAQLSLSAMFASIDRCRTSVQLQIPKIRRTELKETAMDLLATLDAIESYNPTNETLRRPIDDEEINRLKLRAIRYFRNLAAATGYSYALPKEGSLAEAAYFTEKDAQAPPSPEDLSLQRQIDSKSGSAAQTE